MKFILIAGLWINATQIMYLEPIEVHSSWLDVKSECRVILFPSTYYRDSLGFNFDGTCELLKAKIEEQLK